MPWTGTAFLIGAAGDRRAAAAQRLRQRVPAVLRGLFAVGDPLRRAPRRPACHDRRHGADQRARRGLFRQGVRDRVPRRAAQPTAAETAHEVAPADARGDGGAGAALRRDRARGAGSGRRSVASVADGRPSLLSAGTAPQQLAPVAASLTAAVAVFAALIALAAAIWVVARRAGLPAAGVRRGPVWGCGYLFPTRAHAVHGLVLRPAADDAVPPVCPQPRDAGAAAGLFPASALLCQRQRRPVAAAAVRPDLPLVRPRRRAGST